MNVMLLKSCFQAASKLSFFNDDDDEDEGLDEKKRIEKELKKTAAQKKVNKQTQVNITT